jgi:hypothetical protein
MAGATDASASHRQIPLDRRQAQNLYMAYGTICFYLGILQATREPRKSNEMCAGLHYAVGSTDSNRTL